MNDKRCLGDVHYNNDEIMHAVSFQDKNGGVCKQDERTRFAYLVVSLASAKKIAGDIKDDQEVVAALKSHYKDILSSAIKKADTSVQEKKKIEDTEEKVSDTLVHLINIPAMNISSIGMMLRAKKFLDASRASKDLSDEGKKNISYLHKNLSDCKKLILEENRAYKRKETTDEQSTPYALLSMPYVYNYKDENGTREFELSTYEDVLVSLMPKQKIEYGLFFDGTNNNMYNIDFFQNYKKWMTDTSELIEDAFGRNIYTKKRTTFLDAFLKHKDPANDKHVMNLLRDEIIDNVRYFQKASTIKNRYITEHQDHASKHSDSLIQYYIEVKQIEEDKGDDNGIFENAKDWYNDVNDSSGNLVTPQDFIIDKLLPKGIETDSYINGYTNVKRLYEHYEAHDILNPSKSKKPKNVHKEYLRRFKLYASGSGTIDPVSNKELENDTYIGLGLGTGLGGVLAHIVYSCEKIAQELREAKVEHVDELVLDVFGFSRGATEARHFICSIMKEFELLNKDGYHKYALDTEVEKKDIFAPFFPYDNGLYTVIGGKHFFNPLRTDVKVVPLGNKDTIENKHFNKQKINIKSLSFRHANIGDTVTHYGFKQSNDSKDLNIHFDKNKVGSVYHIMAIDEYRKNFEAHSIFETSYEGVSKEEGKFKEILVPGAHADVGGGYENFGSKETVLLPTSNESKIMKWNKKYKWIKDYTLYSAHSAKNFGSDGFYRITVNDFGSEVIYMHKNNLSWEYELVCLKLMHDVAKEDVPLKPILDNYRLRNLKKDGDYLESIYNDLATKGEIDKEKHKELRQRYVHHSSSEDAIANPSSEEGDNIIYGQRVVYGSTGDKFPYKDFG